MWHYILAGVLLTLVWLLVRGLAPAGGLTRSFHYPLAPAANPLRLDIARIPAVEERAADVDLAFLDELRRPTRHYFVRWRGVWFSPRAERIALWAGADDGVVVRIDGEIVLERHPAVGMHTVTRSVALEAGPHTLEIDVQSFADVPNITLVRRARNQGKGAALRDGFARATNDIVIVRHSVNAGSDPSVRDSTASRGAGSRDWLAAVDGEATLSRNGDETVLTWVGREGLPERTGFRLDRDAWPWGIEVLDDAALAESTGGGGGEGGPDGPMSDKRADEVVLGALNGATPSQPTLISELRDAIVLELGSGVSGRGFVPFRASVDRLYQAGSLGASRDPTKRKSGSKLALWVSTKVERVEGAEKGQTPTLSRNQGVRKRGQEKGGDVVPPFSDPSHPVAGTNDPVVEKGHDPSESLAAGAADEWGASRGGWSPRPADLAEADDEASITGLWHFWTRHHVLPVDVGDACEHPISRYLRPDELAHWRALMVDYRALMVDYRAYEDARQTPFTVN